MNNYDNYNAQYILSEYHVFIESNIFKVYKDGEFIIEEYSDDYGRSNYYKISPNYFYNKFVSSSGDSIEFIIKNDTQSFFYNGEFIESTYVWGKNQSFYNSATEYYNTYGKTTFIKSYIEENEIVFDVNDDFMDFDSQHVEIIGNSIDYTVNFN